jgi:type IV secretory pathway TraG/TraD family ATPase VirD4
LLSFGGERWCIRDAAEGTAIWGAPGSGKSSGSGKALARAFLAAGMGGLVLCAKNDEADIWRRYAKEAGRTEDVIVVDASGAQRFNILDYAAANLGGRGFEQNLVELMGRMIEATRVAGSSGGGDGENRFFVDAAMKWLSHAFPLLLVAYGTLRMRDLDQFIATAPQSLAEAQSEEWRKESFCSATLVRAGMAARAAEAAGNPNSHAMQVINEHGEFFLDEVPRLDNRPRSSIAATLTNLTYPFLSGKLAELFCTTTTVTPVMCRDGKIIIMDLPVLTYGAAGAVAQTIFKYLFGLAVQTTKVDKKTRPVFIFADESQFFLNSADADLLSTARSSKTCVVYITQDLPTYYAKLGSNARDVAESLLSKFGTRIFHANSSRETNQAASDLIGKVEKFHVTQTRSKGRTAGAGGSRQEHGGGYNGQASAAINTGESTAGYLDYEVPPDYFATKLRTGSKKHRHRVDGIVVRNARTWKSTNRHWMKAEFRQT